MRWVGPRRKPRARTLGKVYQAKPRVPAQAGLFANPIHGRCRPFVFANYADGVLRDVPGRCPWRSADADCVIPVHSLRERKTGPTHPLAVCRCLTHDIAFTVYPPGFVPYARRTLLGGVPTSARSFHEVAADAAAGLAWQRAAPGGTDRWWPTQNRLLERLFRAVAGCGDHRDREAIAVATGASLTLLTAAQRADGYRSRGRAALQIIDALGPDPLERLLLAGFLTAAWGPAFRWQAAPERLIAIVPDDLLRRSTSSGPRGPPSAQ